MNEDSITVLMEGKVRHGGFSVHLIKDWALKPFPKIINAPYGKGRMTAIILRGSLILAITLTLLLIINGLLVQNIQVARIIIGIFIVAYLVTAEVLTQRNKYLVAAWMLVTLYTLIATILLLVWSLNTSIGILTVSFTVLLAGTLLGTKHILGVTCSVVMILFIVQYVHFFQIVAPDLTALSRQSHFMDVLAYVTIIGIFALISWLSGKQTEHSISRALKAEEKIRAEKINLVQKLNEQSIALRQAQLQEMANLYKFASIGQSTTATLHELSNQLSILSLDINDLQLRHRQSKAIHNAKDGIENINALVRQTRKQLQENTELIRFNAIPIIERSIKELQPKFNSKSVLLHKVIPKIRAFQLLGDPSNLSHVITILINNAFDACATQENAAVELRVIQTIDELKISIIDNGHGITTDMRDLFQPHKSKKPNGLGIGLYITKQIIQNQFQGKISATQLSSGTEFTISLPSAPKS